MYLDVNLEAILEKKAPDNIHNYPMPEDSTLGDLLKALKLEENEVMIAFMDGNQVNLKTKLHDKARISLCPFICGG